MSADPGETLDKQDPGDDVQRRFRYQHAYAAIQCAKLLDPDCTHDAVYCENFEDILLRKKTGTFEGVQVKTRQFKGEPFKSNDAALKKSIARFAELEKKFPGKFDAYHFVTNHGFWDEKQDKNCIAFLITSIKNRGGVKGLPSKHDLRAYIATICNDHDCAEGDVASAMLKMAIVGYESDLEKSPSDLRDIVAGLKDVEGCSAHVARRVADNLMYLTYSASSMTLGGGVASLYELVSDFAAHRDALILLGKTICVDKVTDVVTSSVASDADNLFVSAHLVEADGVPPGMDVLAEKLERGGLQAERIHKVKDFKASMEKLYLGWRYKQDVATANARLNHLKSLVEDDCVEAKIEASEKTRAEYAPEMYKGLRERLSERVREQEGLESELISLKFRAARTSVAHAILDDVSFDACPACGTAVKPTSKLAVGCCYLCKTPDALQRSVEATSVDVIRQDLDARIADLKQSTTRHRRAVKPLVGKLEAQIAERRDLEERLSSEARRFESEYMARTRQHEKRLAAIQERSVLLEKIRKMPAEVDRVHAAADALATPMEVLRRQIVEEQATLLTAEENYKAIERNYKEVLLAIHFPAFTEKEEVVINRRTLVPEVLQGNDPGRSWTFFDAGSGGKKTLLKICYALALHKTAAENGLPLPHLLIIDSPMKNITPDVNREVFENFYGELYHLLGEALQDWQLIIVDQTYYPPPANVAPSKHRLMLRDSVENPPLISYYRDA